MRPIVGMATGWVVWSTMFDGYSQAHYVGAPGVGPLCGWMSGPKKPPAGKRDRITAPADSTRCPPCERMLRAR